MCTQLVILFFLIVVIAQGCVGELVLTEKIAKTITFEGEDLELHVKNPEGQTGVISLCVKSELSTTTADCQQGFASLRIPLTASHKEVTYRVNRQGILNNVDLTLEGTILFNVDQSLDVVVAGLSSGVTLTLVNAAEVRVKEESESTTSLAITTITSQISNKAVIGIVCGVVAFVLVLLVIGLLIGLCVIRKRQSTHQAVPTINPEEGQPRPTEVTNQDQQRIKVARMLSAASKRTSTTTTTKPSHENSKDKASVEPLLTTKTETVENEDAPVKEEKDAQNPKPSKIEAAPKTVPTPTAAAKPQKKKSQAKVPKESHPAPATPKTTPTVTQEANSPLKLDKTQSVSPTTEPTPKFGTDATAKALAANSKLNPRQYLPRNEAPVPGSTVKRRPARITDEVDEFRRATETYPCFAQRLKILSGHDHMKLAERINVTVNHIPSDAERSLLKASPEDAPKWADIVTEEAHRRMDQFSLYHDHQEIAFEEPGVFWQYANNPATPASDAYIIMYILLPAIYKPKKYSMSDPLIRGMPLCGLYTLLLDPTLNYNFRVALAKEIRQKASRIIPSLQRDMFQNAAFPTSYLALAYSKNEASFIDGSEIHSKKATTTQ